MIPQEPDPQKRNPIVEALEAWYELGVFKQTFVWALILTFIVAGLLFVEGFSVKPSPSSLPKSPSSATVGEDRETITEDAAQTIDQVAVFMLAKAYYKALSGPDRPALCSMMADNGSILLPSSYNPLKFSKCKVVSTNKTFEGLPKEVMKNEFKSLQGGEWRMRFTTPLDTKAIAIVKSESLDLEIVVEKIKGVWRVRDLIF